MCVVVGMGRDPGMVIKREYKCRDLKCDVTVSFIVRDDPRCTPPVNAVDTAVNAPVPPPISTFSPVDVGERVAQAVTAPDHTSSVTEGARVQTPLSQPVTRANSEHVSIESIQEAPQPDTKHDAAESVAKDRQPTALPDIVHEAATDAEQIKSIRDRLGSSVDFLKGIIELSEFVSEVSSGSAEMSIDMLSFDFRSSTPL